MLDRSNNPHASRARQHYSLELHRGVFDRRDDIQDRERSGLMEVISNHNHKLEQVRRTDNGSDRLVVTIYAEEHRDIGDLARWFNTWLGTDLRMEVGDRRVFRGICRKMTLWAGESARVVDLDQLANVVRVTYQGDAEVESTSDFYSEESIERFGRKELCITATEMGAADASRMAQEKLEWCHWPRTSPLGWGGGRTQLRCEFAGYKSIFAWTKSDIDDDRSTQDTLKDIVDTFGQGIITYGGLETSIEDNGQIYGSDMVGITGRRAIDLVTSTLDINGKLWRWWVDDYLVFHYRPIDFTPRYWLRHGATTNATGTYEGASGSRLVLPWQAEPGFVRRDTTWPVFSAQADNRPYQSEQDEYIEAVSYDEDGNASFEPRKLTHGQVLAHYGARL